MRLRHAMLCLVPLVPLIGACGGTTVRPTAGLAPPTNGFASVKRRVRDE